jgi:hypothetical protein
MGQTETKQNLRDNSMKRSPSGNAFSRSCARRSRKAGYIDRNGLIFDIY